MQRQRGSDERIATTAATQAGRISRAQLLQIGVGPGAIDHRVRIGRLHVRRRGVYAVGSPAETPDGRWWEALLAYGDDVVLSHDSAATVWELQPLMRGPVELTSWRTGIRDRPGVRVRRSWVLLPHEVTRRRGMRVTAPARTILDLAGRSGVRGVERLVDRAVALGVLEPAELERGLRDHPGRSGSPRVRAVLAAYSQTVTRSELEERLLDLCDSEGLPRPIMNGRIAGLEVDACWPEAMLVVELDGYAYHRSPSAFEADRARDVRLTVAGYRVLRFTYRQLVDEPQIVAAAIRRLLAL
ncbi:MAG: hypothetical protein QOK21_4155 [Solirubrobacteraceae bacterium]|jgi:hypothetical protein|nr:hypothetical protein [Solirubrobacteraceae bacterium]